MFPAQPTDLLPLLAHPRPASASSPRELAGALRRLHRAGVRRGFLLVAPTRLSATATVRGPLPGERDARWWARLCERIRGQTRLSVVLIEASWRGLDPHAVRNRMRRISRRVVVLDDGTLPDRTRDERSPRDRTRRAERPRPERSALLGIARGLCTGDQGLIAEAFATGTPACGPAEMERAIRTGSLDELVLRLKPETMPFTA